MLRIALPFLLLIVAGCEMLESGTDLEAGEILFRIQEAHMEQTPTDPVLTLQLETADSYPCVNYAIGFARSRVRGGLLYTIRGVDEPRICLTAFGPAFGIDVFDLGPGVWEVGFRHFGATIRFAVTITEDAVRIGNATPAEGAVRPEHALYWRYPRNSFALYCRSNTSPALCREFEERLRALIDLEQLPVPEEGIWPYQIASPEGDTHRSEAFYRYANETDWETARQALVRFTTERLSPQPEAAIWLVNWRQDTVQSWTIAQNTP
jgi:hypothetical protein